MKNGCGWVSYVGLLCGGLLAAPLGVYAEDVALEVLPAEHETVQDPETGVEVTFLATDPADDTNLYFHDYSWLGDGRAILFRSGREKGGCMAYIVETGELIRLGFPVYTASQVQGEPLVYGIQGTDIIEATVRISTPPDKGSSSSATASIRVLTSYPEGTHLSHLNPNCDGSLLAYSAWRDEDGEAREIHALDLKTLERKAVCTVGNPPGYAGHLQFSHETPSLLSFAGLEFRLWVLDIGDGKPRPVYKQVEKELVTHEHWWVNEQIVFCGGLHPYPHEDAHVKVLDIHTGVVRIIGAGSWWPEAEPPELSERNFWHCSGSPNGKWVAADDWHGNIVLFDARTTRPYLLTGGHRTYGKGAHPHVGWSPDGRQVIFTSNQRGQADVCIATVPENWPEAATPRE